MVSTAIILGCLGALTICYAAWWHVRVQRQLLQNQLSQASFLRTSTKQIRLVMDKQNVIVVQTDCSIQQIQAIITLLQEQANALEAIQISQGRFEGNLTLAIEQHQALTEQKIRALEQQIQAPLNGQA